MSLVIEHLSHRIGSVTLLDGVSLRVSTGDFCVLVGPSGCGKSTLLRAIAGLLEPTSGDILIDGARVNGWTPKRRDVAMVFQNYALYPHLSVERNLGFPLKMQRLPRQEIRARVFETAQLLGITDLLHRKPATLSGGQMQRVALGRAIVRRPRVFLFDEPLSNLDAKLRHEMRGEIGRLHQRLGITTLYVTHDQAEAMTMGSQIAIMQRGRLEQVGSPLDVFQRPRTTFCASFLGTPPMNLLSGHVASGVFSAGCISLDAPPRGDGALILGIRPHDVADGTTHTAPLTYVERLGHQTHLEVAVANQVLRITREGDFPARIGDLHRFSLPTHALRWFDPVTNRTVDG